MDCVSLWDGWQDLMRRLQSISLTKAIEEGACGKHDAALLRKYMKLQNEIMEGFWEIDRQEKERERLAELKERVTAIEANLAELEA